MGCLPIEPHINGLHSMLDSFNLFIMFSIFLFTNGYANAEMKFLESFTKEMSKKIEADAIYFNYYENLSINYKMYGYIRFFSTGQYAIFRSNTNNVDINDLQKANYVGYYNIKEN